MRYRFAFDQCSYLLYYYRDMGKKGFTLIELLAVIGIVDLLTAVAVPQINQMRESARLAGAQKFASEIQRTRGDELAGQWDFEETCITALDTSGYGNNIIID